MTNIAPSPVADRPTDGTAGIAPAVRKARQAAPRAAQARFRLPEPEPPAAPTLKAEGSQAKPAKEQAGTDASPVADAVAQLVLPAAPAPRGLAPADPPTVPSAPDGNRAGAVAQPLPAMPPAPPGAAPSAAQAGPVAPPLPPTPLADLPVPKPVAQPTAAARDPKPERAPDAKATPAPATAAALPLPALPPVAQGQPASQPPPIPSQQAVPGAGPSASSFGSSTHANADQGSPGAGRSPVRDRQMLPFRLDAPQAMAPPAAPARPAPQEAAAAPAGAPGEIPVPADVRIAQGRADAVDVTISAASPGLRDRLAEAEGELRSDLGRIGTEVDRVIVELRREGGAFSPSSGGDAMGADRDQSFGGQAGNLAEGPPADRPMVDSPFQAEPAGSAGDSGPDSPATGADWLAGGAAGGSRQGEGSSSGGRPADAFFGDRTAGSNRRGDRPDAVHRPAHQTTSGNGRIDRYA